MAFPRVASLLPCCSISTPMISQYHPEQGASSTLMTLGIAAQNHNIDDIATLSTALQNLTKYYNDNQLKANPAKTQVSLFHLRNREVGRKLSLTWNGVDLKYCDFPVYLGVTLDRTLSLQTTH